MIAAKGFKTKILALLKKHKFDIDRLGEITIGGEEYKNGSAFMPLFVQRMNKQFILVAHYYEQNGDSMADPEIIFYVGADGQWYPQETSMSGLGTRKKLISGEWTDGEWEPKQVYTSWQRDTAKFCVMWGNNIAEQQRNNASTITYYNE